MKSQSTRRNFLTAVGRGALTASLGYGMASELGLVSRADAEDDKKERLSFGPREPLVALLQETPADRLLSTLVERLRGGTSLKDLVAAAALANARAFGGEDYVGFHTLMALAPSFHMSSELPDGLRALPVLKVLYRNTSRIQEAGRSKSDTLAPVAPAAIDPGRPGGEALRDAVRRKDVDAAEGAFAALSRSSAEDSLNALLLAVEDATEVHRVVLPYRAWDLLDLVGVENAHTLLRQSVRYCVRSEKGTMPPGYTAVRQIVPAALEKHGLLHRTPGSVQPDDAWIERTSGEIFRAEASEAAEIAAAALAGGIAPGALAEAISLCANALVLRDHGRRETEVQPGKPVGSVHGDSIGVHASDSANAWRNLARAGDARNTFACLILGAYQVAFDRVNRGGDFLRWDPHPHAEELGSARALPAERLLSETEAAVRANEQARAAALVHRWGELGLPARPVFDLLLRYAVSEDGALHAEKYYRTVSEEFARSRAAFRWRHVVALARVTASAYGNPAPGLEEARKLLKA
jgi:hypothetical protein